MFFKRRTNRQPHTLNVVGRNHPAIHTLKLRPRNINNIIRSTNHSAIRNAAKKVSAQMEAKTGINVNNIIRSTNHRGIRNAAAKAVQNLEPNTNENPEHKRIVKKYEELFLGKGSSVEDEEILDKIKGLKAKAKNIASAKTARNATRSEKRRFSGNVFSNQKENSKKYNDGIKELKEKKKPIIAFLNDEIVKASRAHQSAKSNSERAKHFDRLNDIEKLKVEINKFGEDWNKVSKFFGWKPWGGTRKKSGAKGRKTRR